jgi:hypothetical protein
MKNMVIILAAVCVLSVSCSKTNETPVTAENPNLRSLSGQSAPLEKRFVVNGRDTIVLKLVMEPAVACYSYKNGETPKPCDIFIDFTVTLSQPVAGYVSIDITKKNIATPKDPKPDGATNGTGVVFTLAPNTTRFTYRSSFRNNNNITVAENQFSIENVVCYNKVD